MAAETTLRVGDVGTAITITVNDADGAPVDVSACTTKQIAMKRPAGPTTYYDASFVTDGADGQIVYLIEDGDLDETGTYAIFAFIEFSDGSKWTSEAVAVTVKRPGAL